MNTTTVLALALALALAAPPLGAAELYRWVDDKGNVEWRDTPPPSTAKKVEKRNVGGNTIQTSTLPYSVQQAIKNSPVTLWVFECGVVCNDARAHLTKRGVPYTERNSQKEIEVLKKLSGGTEVPLLLVGSKQLKGYLATDWDAALDAAGYPRTPLPGFKPPAKAEGVKTADGAAKPADPAVKPAEGSAKPTSDGKAAAQPAAK